VSDETKAAFADATNSSLIGQHASGKDAGSTAGTEQKGEGEKKVKTEKECVLLNILRQQVNCADFSLVERERKKAEKQAKFDQKKAKVTTAAPASSKTKEKKAKADKKAVEEQLPAYVEETPVGEKKSMLVTSMRFS
jgi:valyl-tRNA synthetase